MGVLSWMRVRSTNLAISVVLALSLAARPLLLVPLCPYRTFCGIDCPTCGVTTTALHFLPGPWETASRVHLALLPVVLIILRACALDLMAASRVRGLLEARCVEVGLLTVFLASCLVNGVVMSFL